MQLIRVIPINGEYFFDPWLMAPLFDDVFGQGNWKLEVDTSAPNLPPTFDSVLICCSKISIATCFTQIEI